MKFIGLALWILLGDPSLVSSCFLIGQMSPLVAEAPPAGPGEAIPIRIHMPGSGFASIGVFNDKGLLVRSLTYAQQVDAGVLSLRWDGTTDLGLPADPGRYQLRGDWFQRPPTLHYLMKVGLSGNPPYVTANGHGAWGGNLGPPMDISTNGKQILAIFGCVESPTTTGLQLMDLDGNILDRYSSFFPWDVRLASTIDQKNFYLAVADGSGKRLVIGKYDIDKPPRGSIVADIPTGEHVNASGRWAGRWTVDVRGLALQNGRLYVPVLLDEKVFVVDTNTGKILHSKTIPSPRGVAAHAGKVFLLSAKTLLQLDEDGSPLGHPVVSRLDDPSGLAIDGDGNFYISDGGASQQVKVFSPTGKPLRQIGIKGGRPRDGIYDPRGMLDPRGLCVTSDGRVWVASSNEDFQEVTTWEPDGRRAKAFYNIRISSGQGRLSPDHSELLAGYSARSDSPGLSSYKVDFEHVLWAPYWHLNLTKEMTQQDDVFTGYRLPGGKQKGAAIGHAPYLDFTEGMVKGNNGKSYLTGGDFSIWLFDQKTKRVKLASLIYTHRAHKRPDGGFEGDYDQGQDNWLTWSDLNDDGRMELNEVSLAQNLPLFANTMRLFGWQLNPDLSVFMLAPVNVTGTPTAVQWKIFRLAPRRILESGVPVYDWSDLTEVVTLRVPNFKGGDGGTKDPKVIYLSSLSIRNGAAYVTAQPGSKVKLNLTGMDGDGWWASRNWRMSPMKFDLKTGAPAWLKLGKRAPSLALPGQMYYPGWGLAGSANGVDFFADALSQVWSWTDDGLYLGPLYNEGGKGLEANQLAVELVGSYVYQVRCHTYILTGDHGIYVHEVELPRMTPINGGSLTLTPAVVAAARPWDPDGPPPGKRPVNVVRSIYNSDPKDKKNSRTISIDGKLTPAEWGGIRPMELMMDGKKVGDVRAVFDQANLYLAYDVVDPNGLRNDGHELPLAPFVSGSYVDFDLGPEWNAPNRLQDAEGDVRVILARITGASPQDYQMGFWPMKRNLSLYSGATKASPHPQTIISPVQQRQFDDISPIPGLVFAYQVTARGYTVEVKVPFTALGFDPRRHPVVGFDASVGFGDPAGRIRLRAAHWAGESEAPVVDRPGAAELKPATWGTMQFDLTPLDP